MFRNSSTVDPRQSPKRCAQFVGPVVSLDRNTDTHLAPRITLIPDVLITSLQPTPASCNRRRLFTDLTPIILRRIGPRAVHSLCPSSCFAHTIHQAREYRREGHTSPENRRHSRQRGSSPRSNASLAAQNAFNARARVDCRRSFVHAGIRSR